MSARAPAPAIPAERLEHPRLAQCVTLHPPQGETGSWIIQRGESRYFRITPDIARLAAEFDGVRDHDELAGALGAPWRPTDVGTVVSTLAGSGMLDDGTGFSKKRSPRFRLAPPLTIQFSVLHPGRALTFLGPVVATVLSKPGRIALAALVGCGLLSMLVQAGDVREALSSPRPLATYVWIFLGILLTTAVHEVAHGAVLTYHGGQPSRLGVMLFYLSPAFFCDVSDGWRLPEKSDRVRVALAGIAVQVAVASLAAVVALALPGSAASALLLFAAATYLAAAFNLVPFIKLDGYIALMSHLDVPHLRQRAIVDGRRAFARFLFGGRYRRELPDLSWSPWYGLACMTFPIYVMAGALVIWLDLLTGLGFVGVIAVLAGGTGIAYYVCRGAVRLVREGIAAGAAGWRMAVAVAALLGIGAAVLFGVRLPVTVEGGYVLHGSGKALFVTTAAVDPDVLSSGASVELYRAGLAGREHVGDAVLAATAPELGPAPLLAFVPVSDVPAEVSAGRLPLTVTVAPDAPVGAASILGPDLPLWKWLSSTYLVPVLAW